MGPAESVESVENALAAGVGRAPAGNEGGDQVGITGLCSDARDARTCRPGATPLTESQLQDEPLPSSISSWSLSISERRSTVVLNSARFGRVALVPAGGTDESSASVELLEHDS